MVNICSVQLMQTLKRIDTEEDREATQEAIEDFANCDAVSDAYAKTVEGEM